MFLIISYSTEFLCLPTLFLESRVEEIHSTPTTRGLSNFQLHNPGIPREGKIGAALVVCLHARTVFLILQNQATGQWSSLRSGTVDGCLAEDDLGRQPRG